MALKPGVYVITTIGLGCFQGYGELEKKSSSHYKYMLLAFLHINATTVVVFAM